MNTFIYCKTSKILQKAILSVKHQPSSIKHQRSQKNPQYSPRNANALPHHSPLATICHQTPPLPPNKRQHTSIKHQIPLFQTIHVSVSDVGTFAEYQWISITFICDLLTKHYQKYHRLKSVPSSPLLTFSSISLSLLLIFFLSLLSLLLKFSQKETFLPHEVYFAKDYTENKSIISVWQLMKNGIFLDITKSPRVKRKKAREKK